LTADLSLTTFQLIRYQQIQFGFIQEIKNEQLIGGSIALLNGEQNIHFSLPFGQLYTKNNATQLDASWDFTYYTSNPQNIGYGSNNGVGAAASLFYLYKYGGDEKPNTIKIELNDWGFIRWNNQTIQYRSQDSASFSGIALNNQFQPIDTLTNLSLRNIKNQYADSSVGAFTTFIPASISFQMIQQHHEKFTFSAYIQHRFFAGYKPYLLFKETFKLHEHFQTGIALGYGGYNNLQLGLEAAYVTPKILINFGSYSMQGLILPGKSSGYHFFIGFKTFIR
jgi:hypothetical protein